MSEGISQSRFNMWRAVLALIYADGVVQPQELEFMDHYLAEVPFNEEQKEILKSDLVDPQDVTELYDVITDIEDRGQFFMFARMLIWCDGDLDAQEEKIFDHLMKKQMHDIDKDNLRQNLVSSREDSRLTRLLEDENYRHEAKEKLSISKIVRDWSVF